MKRFYLAVPLDRENLTLKKIGELGAVQLTREVPTERTKKVALMLDPNEIK